MRYQLTHKLVYCFRAADSLANAGYNSQVLPPAAVNSQHGMADAPHPQAGVPYQAADVPYPPAGAQYPPADTPNPPAGDQARAYQHNQAAALPASLSLQSSQEVSSRSLNLHVGVTQKLSDRVHPLQSYPLRSMPKLNIDGDFDRPGQSCCHASLPASYCIQCCRSGR